MNWCERCVRKSSIHCGECISAIVNGEETMPSNFYEGKQIPIKNLNYEDKPSLPETELSKALDFILQDIKDTLVRKNLDYGNSFEEQFKEYGLTSYLIRDDDKTRRLKNLRDHNAYVNESVIDTVKDKAGYAILMYYLLMKEKRNHA